MAASRFFTVEQKRDIVAAYEAAPSGTKRQVLALHDVSPHQVTDWRAARDAGLLEVSATVRRPVATSRTERAEIARLRTEVARLEAEVARARKDADDRQVALETLGKATALLHTLVSSSRTRVEVSSHSAWGQGEPVLLPAVIPGNTRDMLSQRPAAPSALLVVSDRATVIADRQDRLPAGL